MEDNTSLSSGNTDEEVLPIGPYQEGIWLFWNLNPKSPSYSMPEIFDYVGEFDVPAAESALNEVIRRHEAMRTTFRDSPSGPVQVIQQRPAHRPIKVMDLRGMSEDARRQRLEASIHEEVNTPFDLVEGPLIRLTAFLLSPTETTIHLMSHHIVCDGLSMSLLVHEFGALYAAARKGIPAELAEPAGYGSFVRSQLRSIEAGKLTEESAYWNERLAGVKGSVLPGAPRATTRMPDNLDTHTVVAAFDPNLVEAVNAHSRRTRTTPFAILMGAMQLMVGLATEDKVSIGTAVNGRTDEHSHSVGAFANMVVLLSQVDPARTFNEFLSEMTLDLMDAIDHHALPFSRMVSNLHKAGLETNVDVVRTIFSSAATGSLSFGEGSVSQVRARTVEGPYDLVVIADLTPTTMVFDWEWALRTYSRDTANAYCAAYEAVLRAVLASPEAPLKSLGLTEFLTTVPKTVPGGPETAEVIPASPAKSEEGPQSPLTEKEAAVAAIWAEVIGQPVTDPDDDFFDLGGHSMLASEVLALIRREGAGRVSLRLLFDHPRLRDFCAHLDTDGASAPSVSVPRLSRSESLPAQE